MDDKKLQRYKKIAKNHLSSEAVVIDIQEVVVDIHRKRPGIRVTYKLGGKKLCSVFPTGCMTGNLVSNLREEIKELKREIRELKYEGG